MTDTKDIKAPGFNFDVFMYGIRRDAPFDGSTLADSIADDEVRRAESAFNSLLKRAEKAEAELTALKGDQVPVAWLNDAHLARGHIEGEAGEEDAGPGMIPVYREKYYPPQKPVISKEKLCDWLEDNFDIDDSQRSAFSACFAHCCDCIVQIDSSAPVGEIVAWAGTDREKGITREVDFRFLRFDVLPGTKLYALKPAPAMLQDVLTAVSIGGSRTELIDALTAIKPKFGAPGSRDVDVRAAHVAIDKAIEKLSNL